MVLNLRYTVVDEEIIVLGMPDKMGEREATYRGNPVRSIKNALAAALQETGIKDFRLHDLRHTFTTNARKAEVDRTVIMKLTGHKTLSMLARYNTVDRADAKDAMEKLDSHYAKEGTPSAAIVLQAQKKGLGTSPNPSKSLAPRVGLEPTT